MDLPLGDLLPLAVGIAISPMPIIAVILMLLSRKPALAGLTGSALVATLLIYLLIASITVIVPVIYYLVGGEKAQKTLDGWKTWLTANNAVVMAVLLLIIGLKMLGDGLGALIG